MFKELRIIKFTHSWVFYLGQEPHDLLFCLSLLTRDLLAAVLFCSCLAILINFIKNILSIILLVANFFLLLLFLLLFFSCFVQHVFYSRQLLLLVISILHKKLLFSLISKLWVLINVSSVIIFTRTCFILTFLLDIF